MQGHRVTELPEMWPAVLDFVREGRRKNLIHGLLEVDITEVRRRFREYGEAHGEPLSLAAYLVRCLARTVDENRRLHAYRLGRRKLIEFDEVDVMLVASRHLHGCRQPLYGILRRTNHKSFQELSGEVQLLRKRPAEELIRSDARFFFLHTPRPLRRLVWWLMRLFPQLRKTYTGTVLVSSMSRFGPAMTYPLILSPMTLTLAVGSIVRKPRFHDGEIEEREILYVGFSADHDVLDGADFAGALKRFKTLVESCFELPPPGG